MSIKIIFLSIILTGATLSAFAQSGVVTRKMNLLGFYKYHQDARKLSEKEFLEVLEPYPQSYNLMQSARKNFLLGGIIGSAGMVLTLTQIDRLQYGREIKPAVLIPGLALLGVSLPFNINYKRRSGLALDLYNEARFKSGYFRPKPEFQLGLTGPGLRLQVTF